MGRAYKTNTLNVNSGFSQYNLTASDDQSRGSIPFSFNWPANPSGTLTEVVVTNQSELAAVIGVSSRKIIVESGAYTNLNLNGVTDQYWLLDDNAVFSGCNWSTGNRPQRIRIEGGTFNVGSGSSITINGDDIYLKNINWGTFLEFLFGLGEIFTNRVVMEHCSSIAYNYGAFTLGSPSDNFIYGSDLILVANYLQGGMNPSSPAAQSTVRIQATKRVILVDNRVRNGIDDTAIHTTYRSHYGNEDYYMRRNMTEHGNGIYWQARANSDPVLSGNRMGTHWCYDHILHTPDLSNVFAFRSEVNPTDWFAPTIVDGNVGYTDDGPPHWIWNPQAGDSTGVNNVNPYQPPPALTGWLAGDGLPPGADH